MPMELNIYEECSPMKRTMKEPVARRWGPLVRASNSRCYCFVEKWSWKIRINEIIQHFYPVTYEKKMLWKVRITASTWHHEVDIIILFLVLKAAWWQNNKMSSGCGDLNFFACPCTGCTKLASSLKFMANRGEDHVHQIYMQELHWIWRVESL